jgi:peptidoglycan hydrolase-like protein with peptidoglycan-binding domain
MEALSTHRTWRGWAALAAVAAIALACLQASAVWAGTTGGTVVGEPGSEPAGSPCPSPQFGRRALELGDCGNDVATLNWLLSAQRFGRPPLADSFAHATENAVRELQGEAGLRADGIVDGETADILVAAMPAERMSWYGPGFFGHQTACGQTLSKRMYGVAHRTLPCGTKVVLRYRGRFVRTTVIDRGPYANRANWDLTRVTARALHFEDVGVGDIRVATLPD